MPLSESLGGTLHYKNIIPRNMTANRKPLCVRWIETSVRKRWKRKTECDIRNPDKLICETIHHLENLWCVKDFYIEETSRCHLIEQDSAMRHKILCKFVKYYYYVNVWSTPHIQMRWNMSFCRLAGFLLHRACVPASKVHSQIDGYLLASSVWRTC